ncbi:hypothetical protein [Fluviispira sanaruensis]|uniref:Uncharacterized protein n=1 Tax=Fluviispira sanaruensis TaxID=2493639 RepID=A0A4P2VKG7_FLUSA|nr:hypothetical protein [Fluviispira sanaruensis]BBH52170.1 hypothetical protein JCM31447_314600 [Fluviispira sanaruensis]
MQLLKKLYIPVCMFLPLSLLAKEQTQIKKIGEIRASNTDNSTPGNGMIKVFGMPMSFNCFKNNKDPKNIKFGNLSGQINFSRSVSLKDLSSVLNISAGAEISYASFSATANASYLKDVTDSRYTDNFTFIQTYSADANYDLPDDYGTDLLNQTAAKALAQQKFIEICGDSFIINSKAGASLITTVTLNFNSAQDKTEFDTNFKASISGIASITQAFKSAVSQKGISATLTVRAIQNGGDPRKLAHIFGKPSEAGYPINNCSKDNIQACNQIIDSIISYAQGDFQSGIDINNQNSLYYFNPAIEKYSSYGINDGTKPLTPETKNAIDYLNNQYHQDLENKIYLTKFYENVISDKQLQIFVPMSLRGDIKTLISKYEKLMDYSTKSLSNCFNGDANEKCLSFVEGVKIAHQNFANEGNLRKVYSIKSIIQAENMGNDKFLFIPASIYNTVPTQPYDFGFDPAKEKISGEYFVKSAILNALCTINFNPNIPGFLSALDNKYQVEPKPTQIICNQQSFQSIALSKELNMIGRVFNFNYFHPNLCAFDDPISRHWIKSINMFNNFEHNPI